MTYRSVYMLITAAAILLGIPGTAVAQLELHGFLRQYEAVRLMEPNDFMIQRSRLRLEPTHITERGAFFASFDLVNDQKEDARDVRLDLREAYIDLYFEKLDLRIGKQQIVWGKTDGLFINDIVNPLDLEIFILQDFEDIRIGMPAVKSEFFLGDNTLEAVWIPLFEPVHLADSGADWAFNFSSLEELPAFLDTVVFLPPELPEKELGNSEFGLRYYTFIKGVDLSIMYLHTRDDFPAISKTLSPFPAWLCRINALVLQEVHKPMEVYGGSFSAVVKGTVVRGEGGLYRNRYFAITVPQLDVEDGLIDKQFLQYSLGMDFAERLGVSSGVQFIERRILGYDSNIAEDEASQIMTLRLSADFWSETLRLNLLTLYDLSGNGSIVRSIADYDLFDGASLVLGVDIIDGKSDNFFGQFSNNDLAYFKLKYSF